MTPRAIGAPSRSRVPRVSELSYTLFELRETVLKLRDAVRAVVLAGSVVVTGSVGAIGCAAKQTAEAPKPPRMMEFEDFSEFETAPGVYFAGQPSPEAMDAFQAAGGLTVINLRSERELAFVPYYDTAQVAQGFEYTNIPCSGSTMGRAEYDSFLAAYKAADGPVLLHCASGGRAKSMWAAYEQEELGLPRERVLANAAARGQDSERSQASIGAMLDRVAGLAEVEAGA